MIDFRDLQQIYMQRALDVAVRRELNSRPFKLRVGMDSEP